MTGAPPVWNVDWETVTSRNKQSSLSVGPGGAFASVAFDHKGVPCEHILPYEPSWTPAERLFSGGRGAVNRSGPRGGAAYLMLGKVKYEEFSYRYAISSKLL